MNEPFLPVLPALRWAGGDGYGLDRPRVGRWLEQGVVGFILFGGTAAAAREASDRLHARAGRPLLLGADLERGAGQQFSGATALPPLAALAAGGRRDRLFEAGALTGREAAALGVPWVFAPVADLSLEPRNPIVGTRSPGADPEEVAGAVAAWIRGCLSGGALPCVKHFPGHGRTLQDSHRTLPVVDVDRHTLAATDLVPFQAALGAGVPSVMTAHVAYPALDPTARPATCSRPILHDLLRGAMGFEGVVVTDALVMEGAGDAAESVVEALEAGVDLLLYPPAALPVEEILRGARAMGRLDPEERRRSRERVAALLDRLSPRADGGPPGWGAAADGDRALSWAVESLEDDAGWDREGPGAVSLFVVDDDVGGPYPPPPRDAFRVALRDAGIEVREVTSPVDAPAGGAPVDGGWPLLCVYAEPRGWKGRAGLSEEAREAVGRWAAARRSEGSASEARIVAFGGATLRRELPSDVPVLLAWGGEPLMQTAAALRIAGASSAGVEPGAGGAGRAR